LERYTAIRESQLPVLRTTTNRVEALIHNPIKQRSNALAGNEYNEPFSIKLGGGVANVQYSRNGLESNRDLSQGSRYELSDISRGSRLSLFREDIGSKAALDRGSGKNLAFPLSDRNARVAASSQTLQATIINGLNELKWSNEKPSSKDNVGKSLDSIRTTEKLSSSLYSSTHEVRRSTENENTLSGSLNNDLDQNGEGNNQSRQRKRSHRPSTSQVGNESEAGEEQIDERKDIELCLMFINGVNQSEFVQNRRNGQRHKRPGNLRSLRSAALRARSPTKPSQDSGDKSELGLSLTRTSLGNLADGFMGPEARMDKLNAERALGKSSPTALERSVPPDMGITVSKKGTAIALGGSVSSRRPSEQAKTPKYPAAIASADTDNMDEAEQPSPEVGKLKTSIFPDVPIPEDASFAPHNGRHSRKPSTALSVERNPRETSRERRYSSEIKDSGADQVAQLNSALYINKKHNVPAPPSPQNKVETIPKTPIRGTHRYSVLLTHQESSSSQGFYNLVTTARPVQEYQPMEFNAITISKPVPKKIEPIPEPVEIVEPPKPKPPTPVRIPKASAKKRKPLKPILKRPSVVDEPAPATPPSIEDDKPIIIEPEVEEKQENVNEIQKLEESFFASYTSCTLSPHRQHNFDLEVLTMSTLTYYDLLIHFRNSYLFRCCIFNL
jgi:hypothetical protein